MDLPFYLDRFIDMLSETLHNAADKLTDERPTLRDQFAMSALQGMLAATERGANYDKPASLAENSYKVADAMLKAREPKPETS